MKIVFIITLIVCFVGFTSLLYAEDNATVSIEDKSSESTENTSSTIEDDDFFDNPLPENIIQEFEGK